MRYDRLEPLDVDTDTAQNATVAVVGLGATGSHMAENLARLGADLILIDRDVLEESNLSTSALYTENDVEDARPKAVAAKKHLQAINSEISITTHAEDVNSSTINRLLDDADLVLDGTDNLETRFLLNEYSIRNGTPWIHVSALGTSGEVMPVVPDATACFHCVFGDKDGAQLETCETAGILKETAATAANIATATAAQLLNGNEQAGLTRFDLSQPQFRTLDVQQAPDCSVCGKKEFPRLNTEQGTTTTALCGENKYHINPHRERPIDLSTVIERLPEQPDAQNDTLLQVETETFTATVFKDGRAIIEADSKEAAKSIYSRFIGH